MPDQDADRTHRIAADEGHHPLRVTCPLRLRDLRQLYGLSQTCLSRRSGVPRSLVGGIEAGQAGDVRLSTLLKLCHVFGVSPDYLLGFDTGITRAIYRPYVPPPNIDGACQLCESRVRRGEPHRIGTCIAANHERGWRPEVLAVFYGLTLESIFAVLREEARIVRMKW